MSKQRIVAKVSFACQECGTSSLAIVGAVKTITDQTYLVCQCENGHSVPLSTDSIVLKLYEIAPPQLTN